MNLQTLQEEVKVCTRCAELSATRTQTVFGVGPVPARLMFIGEAPGADEDKQGEPFVGQAGKLLSNIVTSCGWKRDEIYIANTLKCRPPGNRRPSKDEAHNCREYLDKQIDAVNPEWIVCWGATAASNLLHEVGSMGSFRGRIFSYKNARVICTYHPAYLLPHRSPEKKKDVWEDLQVVIQGLRRDNSHENH